MSDNSEYICDPNNEQFGYFPRRHKDIDDLVVKANKQYWPASEVILTTDRDEFLKLDKGKQHVVMFIQMFFSQSDGLVQKNISSNFLNEITLREAQDFMHTQNHVEMIHNQTYGNIIEHLFSNDSKTKNKIQNAIENFKEIKDISMWYDKYMDSSIPFNHRLFAQIFSEGLMFQGCFAILYWIRQYNGDILRGLTKANELISKDENLHAEFFTLMYNKLSNRLSSEDAHDIVKEAVGYSVNFINNAINAPLVGINAADMEIFLKFTADYWLSNVGYTKIWNHQNPFNWMVLMALQVKTNFHEGTPAEYADGSDEEDGLDHDF